MINFKKPRRFLGLAASVAASIAISSGIHSASAAAIETSQAQKPASISLNADRTSPEEIVAQQAQRDRQIAQLQTNSTQYQIQRSDIGPLIAIILVGGVIICIPTSMNYLMYFLCSLVAINFMMCCRFSKIWEKLRSIPDRKPLLWL